MSSTYRSRFPVPVAASAATRQSERMSLLISVHDAGVRNRVEKVLRTLDDLVVWQRMNRGGGSTDWYLLRSVDDFDRMVAFGRPADVFLIFMRPQLPLRGVVTPPLVEALLQNQAASDEWVMGFVTVGTCQLTEARAYMPEDIEWAREVLDDHVGEHVVAGPFPPSLSEDPQVVLAAYVPQPDGTLVQGIY